MLFGCVALFALFALTQWTGSRAMLLFRLLLLGTALLTVFALLERRPVRLPHWLPRWAMQIVAVAATVPVATALIYTFTTLGYPAPWPRSRDLMGGYALITGLGILVSPWIAMIALHRDISGRAQRQQLAFELERSQMSAQALESRMRLLQSQIEPHFLFNTLANVRELVDQRSPRASELLQSLIDYLRSSVPSLNEARSSVAQELDRIRAYLDIMQMRMGDRLQWSVNADARALQASCPPAALLVLVENAVRHGIDPSEAGGSISINVRAEGAGCIAEVIDTGVGLRDTPGVGGLGTGIANLRERLALTHGSAAGVDLFPNLPCGVRSVLRLPVLPAS